MISESKNLWELEPMKYQSFPSSYTAAQRKERTEMFLNTGNYIYSRKTDGNWARMIWYDGEVIIQTRGISKKTGRYGEVQDKLFFTEALKEAFYDTTVLIGEIYMDNGVDKDVGTILRCLPDKAIDRQKKDSSKVLKFRIFDCFYYNGTSLLNTPIIDRIGYLPIAAKAIENKLVDYVKYYEAKTETFWDKLAAILENGGEGVVLYNKNMTPCEGRTPAGQTLKIKQELALDADCFIYGVESAKKEYTGKEITTWQYWMNDKTGEKFYGNYYQEYYKGSMIIPITKSYYNNWPGSILCGVYDENGEVKILCKCSNLTEDFQTELRDNYEKYHMMPVKVQGMMVSKDRYGDYSIRHPKLISIRENDIDVKDCTLEKIIG